MRASELAVGRPQVILKEVDGVTHEPWERLVVELDETYQGPVIETLGNRRGELQEMLPDGAGRVAAQLRHHPRLVGLSDRLSHQLGAPG